MERKDDKLRNILLRLYNGAREDQRNQTVVTGLRERLPKALLAIKQEVKILIRKKLKDKDNRLWGIIRCNACNGTTDCENSPECPEDYDGCIADDILKEIQNYLKGV